MTNFDIFCSYFLLKALSFRSIRISFKIFTSGTRIIDEISALEQRQKTLINMLSQIDPMIYLQKLQSELLSLQEENRQLKLINIAEKLERERRRTGPGSGTSSPRLPDSTTEATRPEVGSEDTSDSEDSGSSSYSEDSEVSGGGCSSGCCLAERLEDRLREVEEEEVQDGVKAEDERLREVEDQDQDRVVDHNEVLPPEAAVEAVDDGAVNPEERSCEKEKDEGVLDIEDTSQSGDK